MSYILPPGLCLVRSIPVAEAKAIAAAEKEAAKAKEEAAVKAAKAKETARVKAAKSKAVAKEKAAITKAEGIAARKVAKATARAVAKAAKTIGSAERRAASAISKATVKEANAVVRFKKIKIRKKMKTSAVQGMHTHAAVPVCLLTCPDVHVCSHMHTTRHGLAQHTACHGPLYYARARHGLARHITLQTHLLAAPLAPICCPCTCGLCIFCKLP